MKPSLLLVLLGFMVAIGCETETATTVVVDNDYPAVPDGGDTSTETTVFKVWWVTSLLPDPVAPGNEGQPQRTVPNSDFAYAVLAPGWDPSSQVPPTRLIPAKSSIKLSVARGDMLHVHVSNGTFAGNCAAGQALSQDDADFITQRIFPGEFAGETYDAKSCSTSPIAVDGGSDARTNDAAPDGSASDGAADAAAD